MVRRSSPKSKTGCVTCRIRRVKCDETKPSCTRCTRAGRVCGFVDPSQTRKTGSSPRKSKTVPGESVFTLNLRCTNTPETPTYNIPSPCSQEILHQLHYFRASCLSTFAGYVDSHSWNRLVLQVADVEDSIQVAAIALASLHKIKYYKASVNNVDGTRPFVLYLRALRLLNQRLDGSAYSQQLALIASVLFMMFDTQSGNERSAVRHLNGGFAIMSDVVSSTPGVLSSPGTFKDLYLSFSHLDVIFSVRFNDQTKSLRQPFLLQKFSSSPDACLVLRDIVARLDQLYKSQLIRPGTDVHHPVASQMNHLKRLLQGWYVRYNSFDCRGVDEEEDIYTKLRESEVLLRHPAAGSTTLRLEGLIRWSKMLLKCIESR